MHWSDEASLGLLSTLSHQFARQPLLVIATYRDEEPQDARPLNHYLPGLSRKPNTTSLHLQRLNQPEIVELVGQRYGLEQPDRVRAADYLHHYAEGNPFFTEELLRALENQRVLRHTVFGWSLAELPRFQLPPALRQVIDDLFIHGDAETCRRKVQEYVDNGVTTPVINFMALGADAKARAEQSVAMLRALAPG